MNIRRTLPALALLAVAPLAVEAQPADLIVTNARSCTADFVVLAQDIMRVRADLVLSPNVLATYVGGRAVYHKPLP